MTAPRRPQDSFTYTITDGTDTATGLVTITVSPVNDPPVGVVDALAVQEGGSGHAKDVQRSRHPDGTDHLLAPTTGSFTWTRSATR